MHPYIRWTLIIFVFLMLTSPLLAADIFGSALGAIQHGIQSLNTFGNAAHNG
jgi:hypothetical protein